MNPASPEIAAAYAQCRRIAYGHYENFPVASWLLPPEARDPIAAVYAFARHADDIADEEGYGSPKERVAHLEAWKAKLHQRAKDPIFLALQDATRRLELPLGLFKDLISAFQQDCLKRRYKNFEEVLDYARRSANPVGRLVLKICARTEKQALQESDAICSALQLANFWQDLASDFIKRDRIYLPQDEMKRFGVREEELRQERASTKLQELLRFQVRRTEALFASGEALPTRLGGRLGTEIRLTLLGGRRILEKLQKQAYDPLKQRPKLDAWDLPQLLGRFVTGALA